MIYFFFFFNDTATTEIYTLSLHDALPIWRVPGTGRAGGRRDRLGRHLHSDPLVRRTGPGTAADKRRVLRSRRDRKSTRLNSSHANISYAVFCLKKKKKYKNIKNALIYSYF